MLRAQAHVCIVCHGTEFTENELGHAVCEDCGTQIVQLSQMEEVNEDNTQIARVGGHLNAIKIKSGGEHVTAHRKKMLSRTYSARMLAVLLRVHQTALRAQANALINKFGMPVKLNAVVRRLWFGYLGAWQVYGAPMIRVFGKTICTSIGHHYAMLWPADLPAPPLHLPPLSSWVSLSFIALACRWLNCGLTPADVLRMASNDDIPFLNLVGIAPADILNELLPLEQHHVRHYFLHWVPPTAELLRERMYWLAAALKVDLPDVNSTLCALRWTQVLGFPRGTWSSLLCVLALLHASVEGAEFAVTGLLASASVRLVDRSALMVLAALVIAVRGVPDHVQFLHSHYQVHHHARAPRTDEPAAGPHVNAAEFRFRMAEAAGEFAAPMCEADASNLSTRSLLRYVDFVRRCFPVPPYVSLHQDCLLLAENIAGILENHETWLPDGTVVAAGAALRKRHEPAASPTEIDCMLQAGWARYRRVGRTDTGVRTGFKEVAHVEFIRRIAALANCDITHLNIAIEYCESLIFGKRWQRKRAKSEQQRAVDAKLVLPADG